MNLKSISPDIALKHNSQTVSGENIQNFHTGINDLLLKLNKNTTAKEEHSERVAIMSFLKTVDYSDNDFAFEEGKIDLAIKSGDKFGVLFETKSSNEKKDMVSPGNLNVKPLHQVIYYYIQQRKAGNNELKHIVITNGYEWYIFDALDFNRIFYENKELLKNFDEHQSGAKASKSTQNFYEEIARKFIENIDVELKAVYFNLNDYSDAKPAKLEFLYKLLSGQNLLKKVPKTDSNKLNTKFFKELLYIMGLEEQKDGNKKVIREKSIPDEGSLIENLKSKIEAHRVLDDFNDIDKYGNTYEEQLFAVSLELVLTWINRLLFIKLLEGQLVDYHNGDSEKYRFLGYEKVNEFDVLDTLFFELLNVPVENRKPKVKERYPNIPYLNSSLFDPSELEKKVAFISSLKDNLRLPLFPQTVLTNETAKDLPTLDYLLKFLGAYNFASHTEDVLYTEKGELINASVLGLVFEKINGYKEGSFYTPGFITEYMARETIRKAVIQKFNNEYKLKIEDFQELCNYTIDNRYKKDKILEYNKLINSLKIVDPAVGSGHFLVSSLNEILAIKSELGILADSEGNRLACRVKIENDTVIINDSDNKLFRYSLDGKNNIIEDKNRIQAGIFREKKTIIENCLFGVDINPNSVKICRLRLWIELLKNAYYKFPDVRTGHALSQPELETLPNIDINIKEGNSLISRFPLDADIQKALKKSKWDISTYQNAVKTYHQATDKEQKREMLRLIDLIKTDFETEIAQNDSRFLKLNKTKGELFQLQNQGGLFEMTAAEKVKWNAEILNFTNTIAKLETELYDIKNSVIYRNAFEWRFEFPEVLNPETGSFEGFDVVIGNPPYIRQEEFSNIKKYLQENYKIYHSIADLLTYFVERSHNILKDSGTFQFIISNKFARTNYGKVMRNFISQNTQLTHYIDFSGVSIFDEATVDSAILGFEKNSKHNNTFLFANIAKNSFDILDFKGYLKTFGQKYAQNNLTESSWSFEKSEVLQIKQKVEKQGIPLKDWNITINYGIKTGLNEAFIINGNQKDEFIKKDADSIEILKPLLRGKDIHDYYVDFQDLWLIHIPKGFTIKTMKSIEQDVVKEPMPRYGFKEYNEAWEFINSKYPAIAQHLQKHQDKAENRSDKGDYWWEQRACAYLDDIVKPKIVYVELSKQMCYYYDGHSYYIDKTCFMMTGKSLKYLSAFMNSKLYKFCFENNFSVIQGGTRVQSKIYIEQIPVKQINELQEKEFENKLDKILSLKKSNPKADTSAIEKEIDALVYELYELTEEEIAIVEGKSQ